jgi:DNA-binding response OmpR family regulator
MSELTVMARVLIVDDEKTYDRSLSVELLLQGFEVAVATTAKEAFFVLEDCPDVDLVLIETLLPGLDAHGLRRRLRAAYPEIRVAFTGSFRLSTRREHLAGWGIARILPKPSAPSAPN